MNLYKAFPCILALFALTGQAECEQPPTEDADGDGWTTDLGDCDDTDAHVYPGATEDTCNGKDDDCDGVGDAGITYIDAEADATLSDGTSWATAWDDFENITAADTCVWVAEGTYKDNAYGAVLLKMSAGQALYGGFEGSEATLDERAGLFTTTILDGDVDGSGGLNDNDSVHLIELADEVIIDGFTIQGGYATGSGDNAYGGGMFGDGADDIYAANLIIQDNEAEIHGGGVSLDNGSIVFENCKFNRNVAGVNGGAFSGWYGTKLDAISSQFNENESNTDGGAIILALGGGDMNLINTQFYRNSTNNSVGAVAYYNYSQLRVENSAFYLNNAHFGIAALSSWTDTEDTLIYNSVFYNNVLQNGNEVEIKATGDDSTLTVNNCATTYAYEGEGNITLDITPFANLDFDGDGYDELILNTLTGAVDGGSEALANESEVMEENWWMDMTALDSCEVDTGELDMGIHYEISACE